jgi:hypothetical protein
MDLKTTLQRNRVWLLPILAGLALTYLYFAPVFAGKQITQDDIMMGKAKTAEIERFRAETGEEPLWTNAMFGGMPTFQLATIYPNNYYVFAQKILQNGLGSPSSIYIIALLFLTFFFLLKSQEVNPWIAALGAFAFAFSGFFIISFAAGHLAKVRTVAYLIPVITGVVLIFKKHWKSGSSILAIFTGLAVYSNHPQIIFYTLFLLALLTLALSIQAIRQGESSWLVKALPLIVLAAVLGAAPNAGNLWSTVTYSKESMRGGGSELSSKENKAGLEFDYAMSWSYGMAETLNLFYPNLKGGGAKQDYTGTQTHDFLTNTFSRQGMRGDQLSQVANQYSGSLLYWGDQSLVNGAYYVGALLLFLFILGWMYWDPKTRWWIAAVLVLSLLMAWGKNAAWFNRFMFDYVPLYNKFRVPSMALVLVFILLPWVGFVGLDRALKAGKAGIPQLWRAFYISGGLSLIIALLGPALLGTDGPRDADFAKQGIDVNMLLADRASLMRNSGFRALFVIAAGFALLFFYAKGSLKKHLALAGLAVLVVGDLWTFDRDQLGSDEFLTPSQYNENYQATAADRQILQDPDPHYRVWNASAGLTSDSYTSNFHKSIGGYHGAKLQRFQDLVDFQLSQQNMACFDMLNVKWIKQTPQGGGEEQAFQNPNACGNAWTVDSIHWVEGADEEIKALTGFKPKEWAVVDNRLGEAIGFKQPTGRGTVQLTAYHPRRLNYRATIEGGPALVVFSEIFYAPQNQAWVALVDGVEVPHHRVNYLLRALTLPAGNHEVVFEFKPKTYLAGERLDLTFSWLLIAGLGFLGFLGWRSHGKV